MLAFMSKEQAAYWTANGSLVTESLLRGMKYFDSVLKG